ncbi:hypothetical protein DSLASN_38160 [Desulfoluna limicola]|uniref:Uncharacterized protein n=1 Tax=Desulfoluna limicola TaxID=2810562 RepID=A0ABN6FBF4_9BACT|nr:hypothetical protein DSLASN_38160 [Desulfoluna limicola]
MNTNRSAANAMAETVSTVRLGFRQMFRHASEMSLFIEPALLDESCNKPVEKPASGGEVSHLESLLPWRFAPHASGQIAMAFGSGYARRES